MTILENMKKPATSWGLRSRFFRAPKHYAPAPKKFRKLGSTTHDFFYIRSYLRIDISNLKITSHYSRFWA